MKYQVLFVIALFCSHNVIGGASFKLNKSEDVEVHETSYMVQGESCEIEWVVKRFPASSGFGISERSRCDLELGQQSDYRMALLKSVMNDTNNLQGIRNFYWGRLKRGDKNGEYSLRLMQAVAKSHHWNAKTGALVKYSNGVNHFVADVLNQDKIFAEVIAVFDHQGYAIKVNGVEKVLIDDGRLAGVNSFKGGKLPFDCVVSFQVRKK